MLYLRQRAGCYLLGMRMTDGKFMNAGVKAWKGTLGMIRLRGFISAGR